VVYPNPTVNVTATSAEVCIGGILILTANVLNGSGTFTYQWESSANGVSGWTSIAGATDDTYDVPTTSDTILFYRVAVTDGTSNCTDPVSAAVQVSVLNDPEVTIEVDDASICEGGTATYTATVTGGIGAASYQWQYNDPFSGWTNMTSETNQTLEVTYNTADDYEHRVVVNMSVGCNGTSDGLILTVNEDPDITVSATATEVCIGSSNNTSLRFRS
jgi:hypothetical protein